MVLIQWWMKMARLVNRGQKGINPKAYPIGSKPGKSAPGFAYDTGKRLAKYFGYYQDIEPYLPEEMIQRPYKEPVTTSIEFARLQKKIFKKTKTSYHKQYQTHRRCEFGYYNFKSVNRSC